MITEILLLIIQIQIPISRTLQMQIEPWACKSEIHHAVVLWPQPTFSSTTSFAPLRICWAAKKGGGLEGQRPLSTWKPCRDDGPPGTAGVAGRDGVTVPRSGGAPRL